MAAGKLNFQAADGAVIGLVVPDGLTSGERQIALGANLSGITAYHLLQGNVSATVSANYVEVSSTTTRNYTASDYIFDSTNYKLYDCIMASTAGTLLTNTTYFTSITAGTLSINNALIPLAQGIDGNGVKNTILSKNETITGLPYTQGKNYVYCDKNGAYGVTPYKPRFLESELVRTFASEAPEYYDVVKNKWFSTSGQGELITNGTFNNNLTGWTIGGTTIPTWSSGTVLLTTGTVDGYIYQSISTTIGKKYKINVKGASTNGATNVWFEIGTSRISYLATSLGNLSYEFVAQSTSTSVFLSVIVAGSYRVDDISVFASDIVPTTEITNSRNYLNHIVHADNDGGVLYVEELPKVEYKDIVKANEFRGKNACTALISFDGTTTPITIRDSYNVSAIIRVATGVFDIYFKEQMDNTGYSIAGTGQSYDVESLPLNRYLNKVQITTGVTASTRYNDAGTTVIIMGGKN